MTALSILIDSDEVTPMGLAVIVSQAIGYAPRRTVVVRLNDGTSVIMRDPKVKQDHLASPRGVAYFRDIQSIEAYDPHPNFDPNATLGGGV